MQGDLHEYSWVAIFNNIDDYNTEKNYQVWSNDDTKSIDWCNTLWNGLTYELTEGMVVAVGFGTAGIRKVEAGLFDTFWN